MKKKKFGFVVLHYMAFEMTNVCVKKLLDNFSNSNIQIVVVDNGSSNNSGEQLEAEYKNNEFVSIINVNKNLGFAQGNNIGYLYLKANFNPDFIIVINNDVLIDDKFFLAKINNLFALNKFAVLGPDIYNPKLKIHQNPCYSNNTKFLYGRTLDSVLENKKAFEKFLQLSLYYYMRHIFFGWIKKFFKKNKPVKQENVLYKSSLQNCVLHGACYIFSEIFIEKRNLAFNPGTFLYFEEDILHLECKMQDLTMIYSPTIKVAHLEDVSTDFVIKSKFKKMIKKRKFSLQSMDVFLKLKDTLPPPLKNINNIYALYKTRSTLRNSKNEPV